MLGRGARDASDPLHRPRRQSLLHARSRRDLSIQYARERTQRRPSHTFLDIEERKRGRQRVDRQHHCPAVYQAQRAKITLTAPSEDGNDIRSIKDMSGADGPAQAKKRNKNHPTKRYNRRAKKTEIKQRKKAERAAEGVESRKNQFLDPSDALRVAPKRRATTPEVASDDASSSEQMISTDKHSKSPSGHIAEADAKFKASGANIESKKPAPMTQDDRGSLPKKSSLRNVLSFRFRHSPTATENSSEQDGVRLKSAPVAIEMQTLAPASRATASSIKKVPNAEPAKKANI
ncbi:unnamed protein product [Parascedosporium putredinis]|uniref:Uncharacterized protein n=1 Tax=Parascedosporium putredinis TaxID=1442378 RepID=A0A9P1MDW1_9PEZI|nr:unnamed protein product [Parascedosporium putredinis]CAI8000372.1 unnamed protein product [Parascedosporium putredinis]